MLRAQPVMIPIRLAMHVFTHSWENIRTGNHMKIHRFVDPRDDLELLDPELL